MQRIVDLLKGHGHEVEFFFRDSADIPSMFLGKFRSFFTGIFSYKSRQEVARILKEFQPDIVQIQNLFPLISPSVLPVIKAHSIPVVMRLSNYRLICPNGLFLAHGVLCQKCRKGKEYFCVIKNCESSICKSLGYALRNWVARKFRFYHDNVTLYYAQTEFQKNILVSEGFAAERIDVIPNMVNINTIPHHGELGKYVGFAGRISPEKGISTLIIAAAKCTNISFKLAGDYRRLPELASSNPVNVEFLGNLDKVNLEKFYQDCRMLIMPSICFEGFPGVLIEAMLHGKPVICSRIGGLPEIVKNEKTGLLFAPGDADDLAQKIEYLWGRPELCKKMGEAGREKVMNEYSPDKYYNRLMNVYEKAILLNQESLLSSPQTR